MMRGLGKGVSEFKKGVKDVTDIPEEGKTTISETKEDYDAGGRWVIILRRSSGSSPSNVIPYFGSNISLFRRDILL